MTQSIDQLTTSYQKHAKRYNELKAIQKGDNEWEEFYYAEQMLRTIESLLKEQGYDLKNLQNS